MRKGKWEMGNNGGVEEITGWTVSSEFLQPTEMNNWRVGVVMRRPQEGEGPGEAGRSNSSGSVYYYSVLCTNTLLTVLLGSPTNKEQQP